MKNTSLERKPMARWIAFALAATTAAGVAQAAAPLAGTEIKNLATVSYEDENGNKYTAQSNEAVITVKEQYRATLENDKSLVAAAGQTVYFPHTLVNTGNIADTYALSTSIAAGVKIYKDTNGNGQPDNGEPEITSLTLPPGETGNIVVSYMVPANAVNGDETTIVLTAQSSNADGVVEDIGANFDNEATGENTSGTVIIPLGDELATNHDKVTVTNGPVLVLNKESVIDTNAKTITYTLTVKNTGGSAATGVDIYDALPMVDTDGDGTADTQTTLVANSIVTNGLLDAGDSLAVETDESALGKDVDGVGGNLAATKVIHALDATITPNTTISISYAVAYLDSWAANAAIDNTFTAESPDVTTPPKSNTTHNAVPQNYSVVAEDDQVDQGAASNVNDGKDDDLSPTDDSQYVNTIAAGDTVVFTHTIENTGNGDDIFNLQVNNDSFPPGTVFTLWNEDGTVQLTDSDSDGIPDTGILGQNTTMKVVVKADLPSGISKAGPSIATLSATSSGDDTKTDDTELKLGEITAPAVDLSATAIVDGTGFQVNSGFNDGGVENAHDEGPVLLANGIVGGTVTFPMSVANEAGSPDSFILGTGATNPLPDGWTVVFKDLNGDTITSTPFIPAGQTFDYIAEVTISSDPAKALGNSDRATDDDGNDIDDNNAKNLTNADGDNDYAIDFTVTSSVDASRNDTITHAVDVADIKSVTITPDGQNQIQPGGTVNYPHKLVNDGNVDEAIELNSGNSDPDWSSTTLIEKVVGGVVTLVELTNLVAGDVVRVYNPDGTTEDVTLTDTDTDTVVEFPLKPGQFVKITDKVFAPADAAQGEVNTTTLTAADTNGTLRSEAKDTSTVILGQVRLTKTVALDANCDNTADGDFAAIQSAKVEPGQCAIWKIVAKNEGDAIVKNVIINDSIPAYTDFLANSLRIAGAANPTDAVADDAAEADSGKVTYYLGSNRPNNAPTKGGELQAGETSTVYFTVQVEK